MRIRTKPPIAIGVLESISVSNSPLLVRLTKNTFFDSLSGVSADVILSRSSKYCQYNPAQAIPSPFFVNFTLPISGVTRLPVHDVLKYPVPASIIDFGLGVTFLPPTLISTLSFIDKHSVPFNNKS